MLLWSIKINLGFFIHILVFKKKYKKIAFQINKKYTKTYSKTHIFIFS